MSTAPEAWCAVFCGGIWFGSARPDAAHLWAQQLRSDGYLVFIDTIDANYERG